MTRSNMGKNFEKQISEGCGEGEWMSVSNQKQLISEVALHRCFVQKLVPQLGPRKNIYDGAFKRELLKAFSSLFSQKSSFIDTFEVPKYAYEKVYSEIT